RTISLSATMPSACKFEMGAQSLELADSSSNCNLDIRPFGPLLSGARWLLPCDPTFPVAARDSATGSRFVVRRPDNPCSILAWRYRELMQLIASRYRSDE